VALGGDPLQLLIRRRARACLAAREGAGLGGEGEDPSAVAAACSFTVSASNFAARGFAVNRAGQAASGRPSATAAAFSALLRSTQLPATAGGSSCAPVTRSGVISTAWISPSAQRYPCGAKSSLAS
jgi:hypothetical protein